MRKTLFFLILFFLIIYLAGNLLFLKFFTSKFFEKVGENLKGKIRIGRISFSIKGIFVLEDVEITSEKPLASLKKIDLKISAIKFLKEKNLISSIEKVKIYNPKLYLEIDKNGRWNIIKIFPERVSFEKVSPFKGRFEISDGEVLFKDCRKNNVFFFSKINSEIEGKNFPILFFKISSVNKGVKGIVNLENFYILSSISAFNEDVAAWGNYLFPQMEFGGGKFDLNLFISKRKELYFQGNANLKNSQVRLNFLPGKVQNIQTHIYFNPEIISFQNLKFNFGKSIFEGKGTVFDVSENPQIDLTLKSKKLFLTQLKEISPFLSRINLKGICLADIKLKGELKNPEIISRIVLKNGKINQQNISDLDAYFKYYNGRIILEDVSARIENGKIFLNAIADLKRNRFVTAAYLQDVPAEIFKNFQIKGLKKPADVSGNTQAIFLANSLSPLKVSGVFRLDKPEFKKISFDRISAVIDYEDGKINVKKSFLEKKNAKIVADGMIEKDFLDMKIEALDLNLDDILKEKFIDGNFDFSGSIRGNTSAPLFSGEIYSEDATFMIGLKKEKFKQTGKIRGRIFFRDNALFLEDIKFISLDSESKLRGKINFYKKDLEIEVFSRNFNISLEKPDIDLKLDANLNISGTFESPCIKGELNSENILFKEQKIDRMNAKIFFEKNSLYLEDLSLNLKDSHLKVQGITEFTTDKLDFTVSSSGFNLSSLNLENKISGKADISGKIKGRWEDPVFEFEIKGEKIGYLDEKIGDCEVYIYAEKSFLNSQIFLKDEKENYYFSLLARPENAGKYLISGKGKILEGNLQKFYLLKDYLKDVETGINADFNLEGKIKIDEKKLDLENSKISLRIDFKNSRIYNFTVEKGEIETNFEDGNIKFSKFQILSEQGILEGRGFLSNKEDSNFVVEVSSLNLEYLRKDLKGNIFINIGVDGKINSPHFISFLEIEDLSFKEESFNRARGILEYSKEGLKIKEFVFVRKDGEAKITGVIPLEKGRWKISEEKEIALNIETEGIDASFLKVFLPDVIEEVKGKAICHLNISGTVLSPEIYGRVSTDSSTISLRFFPRPISDFSLSINCENKEIVLNSQGSLGEGNFDIKGRLNFVKIPLALEEITSYNFLISAKKIYFDYFPLFKGEIEGNISFKKIEFPEIAGDIKIANSVYTLTKKIKDYSFTYLPFPPDTSLNIKLDVGEDVWIKNENLNMQTTGKLNILGTLEHPKLLGELTSNRGTIAYLSSLFRLKEAVIFFEKIDSLEPTLSAVAETTLELNKGGRLYRIPVEIVLDAPVSSLAENIQFKYDDTEYYKDTGEFLTRSQVIAALSGFSSVEELLKEGDIQKFLEREADKFLAANLRLHIFDPLEQKIEEVFKLKEFRFDYTVEKEPEIVLGKYLFKNFSITYHKIFSLREYQGLKFEYEFLKNQNLDFQIIQKGEFKEYRTGVGMKLRI